MPSRIHADGCRMPDADYCKKTHYCTQETHRLQIIAHRRHSLHCIGGSCMLQGSRQPFKSSRISNLDQTNSLSRFTSYKWLEGICSLEHLWTLTPPGPSLHQLPRGISSPDISSPSKLMSGGANVCLYPYSLSYRAFKCQ